MNTESQILFYASLVSVVISIGVGYTFDIFGRRNLIALSYALLVIMIWTLPYVPSINLLIVNRACVQVAFQYLHSHPLVIDYIKSESRGKATALQALGNGVGEGFAMIVLITIQMHTSP